MGVGIDDLGNAAEEKAIDYARKRAVYLAARTMGGPDAGFKVARFSEDTMRQIIRGTNIDQTKRNGNVTYIDMRVTIVEEMLRKALKMPPATAALDAASATKKIRGVLVLPVFVGPENPFVWEKENELRNPLAEEVIRQSHGSVLVANGDFEDLRLIDAKNVLTVTSDELKPMFERYGTREIVIAILTPSPEGKTTPTTMILRRLTQLTTRTELLELPNTNAEEKKASRMSRAVAATANALTRIAASTSEDELAALAKATPIKVRFNYATSREMGQMERAIRLTPGVMMVEMPTIALNNMAGTIYFDGDRNLLQSRLSKQNIFIRDDAGGWVVSLR